MSVIYLALAVLMLVLVVAVALFILAERSPVLDEEPTFQGVLKSDWHD